MRASEVEQAISTTGGLFARCTPTEGMRHEQTVKRNHWSCGAVAYKDRSRVIEARSPSYFLCNLVGIPKESQL